MNSSPNLQLIFEFSNNIAVKYWTPHIFKQYSGEILLTPHIFKQYSCEILSTPHVFKQYRCEILWTPRVFGLFLFLLQAWSSFIFKWKCPAPMTCEFHQTCWYFPLVRPTPFLCPHEYVVALTQEVSSYFLLILCLWVALR